MRPSGALPSVQGGLGPGSRWCEVSVTIVPTEGSCVLLLPLAGPLYPANSTTLGAPKLEVWGTGRTPLLHTCCAADPPITL